MKIYKYRFTKVMTAFIWAGMVLALAAFAMNTYFVITENIESAANAFYPILRYTLMYLVSTVTFVLLLCVLLSSYYSISGTTFKTSFGVIKSKYDISKIESVVLDRKTNKLSIYFGETDFIVVVVKEEWYEKFIDDLLQANPNIEYTIASKENDIDEKK
ncbi:MAG: hypothetical protein K2I29_03430 [Clostridia bacterium]|nr:hypothetical protein [Clostridia bacterium]